MSSHFKTLNKKLRAGYTNGLESSGVTSLGSGVNMIPGIPPLSAQMSKPPSGKH